MTSRARFLGAVWTSMIGGAGVFAACGGSTTSGTPTDAGADVLAVTEGGTDAQGPTGSAQPPPMPAAPAATTGSITTFAMQTLFLGGTDRAGVPSDTAWKTYGYDVDQKVTTSKSTDVCTLASGAPKASQADGNSGIDNSFGENILPILLAVTPTYEADESKSVRSGAHTLLFTVDGLTGDAAQTNTGLKLQVFLGATFAGSPTFTPADDWPVDASSLTDNATIAGGSIYTSTDAYVVNGKLVAHLPKLAFPLGLGSGSGDGAVPLSLRDVVVTFDHTAAGTLDNGVISGVMDPVAYVAALKLAAGRIQQSLCSGAAFDQIAQQILQAQDIALDGTNTPGASCNGISVGLGLVAKQVGNPDKVSPAAQPGPDPCAADQ